MKQLDLDSRVRTALARRIVAALEGGIPGSMARLRGSLAQGTADAYSDIDLTWEVPDEAFRGCVERVGEILARAQPVESVRSAPDFQRSDRRRLFFVQFQEVPLFWRADLDVLARSVGGDLGYDVGNEAAWGDDSSPAHSALMNAVAAVKALLRGQDDTARGLLARGFARVGLAVPGGDPRALIVALAEAVAALDATQAGLARRVVALHRQAFGPAVDVGGPA
jgi:hypothetical protein